MSCHAAPLVFGHAHIRPDLPTAVRLFLPECDIPATQLLLLLTLRRKGVRPFASFVRDIVNHPQVGGVYGGRDWTRLPDKLLQIRLNRLPATKGDPLSLETGTVLVINPRDARRTGVLERTDVLGVAFVDRLADFADFRRLINRSRVRNQDAWCTEKYGHFGVSKEAPAILVMLPMVKTLSDNG